MQTRRLNVHIDRLTLEGKSPAEGRRIVAAIERRLTQLANGAPSQLAANRFAARNAVVPRLDTGVVAHGASADSIGSHIATQVFRKLGGARNE